jgi:hypothetical protein
MLLNEGSQPELMIGLSRVDDVVMGATITPLAPMDQGNSRRIDWHLWSDSPAMAMIVSEIARTIEKPHLKAREANLRVIVTNLVAVHLLDPLRYVAYSRRTNAYVKPKRYNEQGVGYDPMIAVTNSLLANKWCEQLSGDVSPNPKNRKTTRIRALSKMADLIKRSGITLEAITRHIDEELIILRDFKEANEKKGKDIDYDDLDFTRTARDRLRAYNALLQRHRIDPPSGSAVDPFYTCVRRIFVNKSFEEGGRFYGGWWQSLSEVERANIRIDSRPVVELDYRAVHLYLAYWEKGLFFKDDPYKLPSLPDEARPVGKTALLALLNGKKKAKVAQGRSAVVAATRESIRDSIKVWEDRNKSGDNRYAEVKELDSYLKGPRLPSIVDEMMRAHVAISDQFFSGNGNRYQRKDSDLVDYILGKFVERDKPILPVHDSFVVKQEDESFLRTAMENACKDVLDFDPCEIKHLLSWIK